MKKMMEKLSPTRLCAKLAAKRFVREQRGDTNFISIAIILIVVLAVAVLFIQFKDKIIPLFTQKESELVAELGK